VFDRIMKDDSALDAPRAVSVLLVAAARADGVFAPEEARTVARQVSRHFDLSPEDTAELVVEAAGEERLDLFPITRWLCENLTRDQRADVLKLMWRVVLSDGKLEAHEDLIMRRAARMLDVAHRDLVALKLAVKRERDIKES